MQQINESFNQKHLKNIRNRVYEELGRSFQTNRTRSAFMRAGVVFAVFAVCFLTITPALAAEIPFVNDLLYSVLPETAQFFKPVRLSVVDQNIEIKVESAYVHGAEAEVVVSVRDLEGDRLDELIDFYDTETIRTGFDSIGTCNQIGYDASTGTATLLIQTSSMNPRDMISGKKITISFQTILSGKEERQALPIQVDWSTISNDVNLELLDHGGETVLAPGGERIEILDGFFIAGIGYVGDQLHIQLYTPNRYRFDDHAFLYLKSEEGTEIRCNPIYRGGYNTGDPEMGRRADYIEYVFDVPQQTLSSYQLYGDFYSAKTRVDGDWSITFPLVND
jgi:hypothetical protein